MPHVVGSVEVYEQQTSAADSGKQPLWCCGDEPAEYLKIARSSTDEQGLEYFHQLKNLANQ